MSNNQSNENKTSSSSSLAYLKSIFDFVEMFAVAACAILLIFTFVARLTIVDGDSMDNTLASGERVLISDMFYTPKAGDIVVVQSAALPGDLSGKAIVKRVIATEGQTVIIKNDGVYVFNADGSGGKLDEYSGALGYTVIPCTYAPQEFTVDEGEIFVMGDNRPVSLDSRAFGCVDSRAVIGRALLRVAPLSRFGTID